MPKKERVEFPEKGEDLPRQLTSLRRENIRLKKELKKAQSLLRLLQKFAPQTHFCLLLKPGGKIRVEWGAEILQKCLGFLPEFLPPALPPALHPESHDDFKAWWKKLLRGEDAQSHFHFRAKEGEDVWIRAFGHPHTEGKKKIISRIFGVLQDITQEKQQEAALRRSEIYHRQIIEEAVEGFFQSTPEGHFLKANPAIARILGYQSPEELINSPQPLAKLSYIYPEKREEYKKLMEERGQVTGFVFQVRHPDGRIIWLLENARAVRDEQGKILYYEGHVQDITSQKEAERALMESQARLEALINAGLDLIYFKDVEGKYLVVNQAFERWFGLDKKTILGRTDEQILPPDLAAQCRASDAAAMESKKPLVREERLQREDAQEVIFETIKVPVLANDGSLLGVVGISRDITLRKKTEQELRSLVQEKEILLREIHHRVKNNMQVISSLLSLQAQKIEDTRAIQALKECQERIRSMALVHDKLYQQEAFNRIEFSSYLRSLATHLFHAYQVDASLIQLRVEAEEIQLNINTAIPCGLIVNELVTNSLKHAFSPGQKGEIVITLRQLDKGRYFLRVKDSGQGLPPHLDLNHLRSLGLEIVQILVQQLGGSLEVKVDGGTEFRITFEEQIYPMPEA